MLSTFNVTENNCFALNDSCNAFWSKVSFREKEKVTFIHGVIIAFGAKIREGITMPNSHITPERFVRYAWEMNFRISIADSAVLHSDFIKRVTQLAKINGISVHYLDFSQYETAEAALCAKENSDFLESVESGNRKSLLWFVNCESLTPLNLDIAYSLRTALTTRHGNNVQSVFVADKKTLLKIFYDRNAPFYHSHFNLT